MTQVANQTAHSPLQTAGDRFLTGLSVMLVANLLQRVIGLLRNLGFCHFLSDAELGHWSLANSFFVIAAPIAVLGCRVRSASSWKSFAAREPLGTYLRSLTLVSTCGLVTLSIIMATMPEQFAWLVFNDASEAREMFWLISTLAAVTAFTSLTNSSRRYGRFA